MVPSRNQGKNTVLSDKLPVAVTLTILANKEAFLLKADCEPFYRGDGLSDGRLQGLLREASCVMWGFSPTALRTANSSKEQFKVSN